MSWSGEARHRGGMAAYEKRVGMFAPGVKAKRRRRGRFRQRQSETKGMEPRSQPIGEVIYLEERRR